MSKMEFVQGVKVMMGLNMQLKGPKPTHCWLGSVLGWLNVTQKEDKILLSTET